MLKALKNQLNTLARQNEESFRDFVSLALGKDDARQEAIDLKNFIVMMPDMIAQIRRWAEDPSVPAELRRLHGFALTYLYHPEDLLPDEKYGLYGYLDDAYMVGEVYHRTMFHIGATASAGGDLDRDMSRWLALARKVAPSPTRRLDAMISDLLEGKKESFEAAMGDVASFR